jgi:hypothetical protein
MKIEISAGAEADVADGYWFYERQSIGLGDYFRSCIFVDIESLRYFGGIHEIENGFHRSPKTSRQLALITLFMIRRHLRHGCAATG